MAIYVVTYDLNKEPREDHRTALREAIKQQAWARLSESCYAVEYAGTAKQLYDRLLQFIDRDDVLFVVPANHYWYGSASTEVIQWMRSKLTVCP